MELGRRDFFAACTGCALSLGASGCTAVNPAPLLVADADGRVSVDGKLENSGDEIKVRLPDPEGLVLVWRDVRGYGAASIRCPHRGSEVHFNAREGTLDCPSHGSRFDRDGKVLEGPATRPLVSYRVQVDAGVLTLRRT